MLQVILKLITMIFSPEFEGVLGQIKKANQREESRELEKAKEAAQGSHDTRPLQKKLGEYTE